MDGAISSGLGGARQLVQGWDETSFLGLPVFYWLILVATVLVVLAIIIAGMRKRKRQKLVSHLQRQRMAMESATSNLFSERLADEIAETVPEPGKPETVLSKGRVAYTEAGEMLVFESTPLGKGEDAVTSRVGADDAVLPGTPTNWKASYRVERVIALHITGVVMFSVDGSGRLKNGRELDPDLLIVLERLLEEARWLGGEMVSRPFKDRTVCLSWGEDIHMAAVVDGEPDERLDRELRWAIGDMVDQFSDELWSWEEGSDTIVTKELIMRITKVFGITADVDIGKVAVRSPAGDLRVTSTVSWRNSLAEYTLGIMNHGPGSVHEVEILPALSKDGVLDVATVNGIEVSMDMRFKVPEIGEGEKAVASFVFRPREPAAVSVDCTVVYLRGVANVQKLRLPGRQIELVSVHLQPGEPVEPERALELATQPAAFRDRCALQIPRGVNPEGLLNIITELLKTEFYPVVELEDDEGTQQEAWFHADVLGGGTVIVAITMVPKKGIVDIFASSTIAAIVPGTMYRLKEHIDRAAHTKLKEVLDPELRTTVPRMGVLLYESWGAFFDE